MTQKKLKSKVVYNHLTGIFTKKDIFFGSNHNEGYLTGWIGDKQYLLHRLAWLYVYGYLPENIDHINHDRSDNRISNLREVTRKENQQNMSMRSDNVSGVTGVSWDKSRNRWAARIKVDAGYIYLGRFAEFSDAVNARKNAEVLYGFHANHGKA